MKAERGQTLLFLGPIISGIFNNVGNELQTAT
jgi:hypothetical protein